MSEKYKIRDKDKAYFITMTVVGWVDIFIRKEQKLVIVNSLKHCQKEKGLEIYGWCLMSSHLHLICKAIGENELSDILRDLKKYTSKQIIKNILEYPESRRDWMLKYFSESSNHLKKKQEYKIWQSSNQPKEISSMKFFHEKLEYIHKNPVEEMIVSSPEEYLFSSARNYSELDSMIEIVLESSKLVTYN